MSNLKVSQENQADIGRWKNLQKYPMWVRIVRELEEKIKLADQMINMIGGDREVEYTKRDIAIIKKNAYLDLIELPEKMITMLSGTGKQETENMDAFGAENEEPETDEEDEPADLTKLDLSSEDFDDDL